MAFNPIGIFRKYQRFWMAAVLLMCMISFVVCTGDKGGFQDMFLDMFRKNQSPIVAKIDGVSIHSNQLHDVKKSRQVANDYMKKTLEKLKLKAEKKIEDAMKDKGQLDAAKLLPFQLVKKVIEERLKRPRFFDGGMKLEDLVDFKLWLTEADKLGIPDFAGYLERLLEFEFQPQATGFDYDVFREVMIEVRSNANVSANYIRKAISDEYRVHMAKLATITTQPATAFTTRPKDQSEFFAMRQHQPRRPLEQFKENLGVPRTPYPFETVRVPVSPAQLGDFYAEKRTEFNLVMVPILAKDFFHTRELAPTDPEQIAKLEAELQQYFKDNSSRAYDPTSEDSGFQLPAQLKVTVVSAKLDMAKIKAEAELEAAAKFYTFAKFPQVPAGSGLTFAASWIGAELLGELREKEFYQTNYRKDMGIEDLVRGRYITFIAPPLGQGNYDAALLAFEAKEIPQAVAAMIGAGGRLDGPLAAPAAYLNVADFFHRGEAERKQELQKVKAELAEEKDEAKKKKLQEQLAKLLPDVAIFPGVDNENRRLLREQAQKEALLATSLAGLGNSWGPLVPFAKVTPLNEAIRREREKLKDLPPPKDLELRLDPQPTLPKVILGLDIQPSLLFQNHQGWLTSKAGSFEGFSIDMPDYMLPKYKKQYIEAAEKKLAARAALEVMRTARKALQVEKVSGDGRALARALEQELEGQPLKVETTSRFYDRFEIKDAPELKALYASYEKWYIQINGIEGREPENALKEGDFDKIFFDKGESFLTPEGRAEKSGVFDVHAWPPVLTNKAGKTYVNGQVHDAFPGKARDVTIDLFALASDPMLFWISKKEGAAVPDKLATAAELQAEEKDLTQKTEAALFDGGLCFKDKDKFAALAKAADKLQAARNLRERVEKAWKTKKARDKLVLPQVINVVEQLQPSAGNALAIAREEARTLTRNYNLDPSRTVIELPNIAPLMPTKAASFAEGHLSSYTSVYSLPKNELLLYPTEQMAQQLLIFGNPKGPVKTDYKPIDELNEKLFKEYQDSQTDQTKSKRLVQVFTNKPHDRFFVTAMTGEPNASLDAFFLTYRQTFERVLSQDRKGFEWQPRDPFVFEAYNGIAGQEYEAMMTEMRKRRVEILATAEERKSFETTGD